jgi:hypothetical protein
VQRAEEIQLGSLGETMPKRQQVAHNPVRERLDGTLLWPV